MTFIIGRIQSRKRMLKNLCIHRFLKLSDFFQIPKTERLQISRWKYMLNLIFEKRTLKNIKRCSCIPNI